MRWSIFFIVILSIALICVSIWTFALTRNEANKAASKLQNHHLLQFTAKNLNELQRFRELFAEAPLNFWSNQFVQNVPILFQLPPENVSSFSLQMELFELPFVVLTPNLQRVFDESFLKSNLQKLLGESNSDSSKPTKLQIDLNTYNPLEKIVEYLNGLHNSNSSDLFELTIYGKSYEDRDLHMVRISEDLRPNASNPTCPNKARIFFECGIHAREWLSPAVCLQFIDNLLHRVEYTTWLRYFEFYFVPVFNPDGYLYSWTNDRMWRKNRRHVNANCYGVDLNRNFGVGFKSKVTSPKNLTKQDRIRRNEEEMDSNPCSNLYPGSTPFSEHETHNFHTLLKSMNPKPTVYFSMHAYSQVWIYPYGYTSFPSENVNELDKLTRLAVEALEKRHGSNWKAGPTIETLYGANGIAIDWVHKEARVPYVFTLEMRDNGGYGFLLPEDQITPAAEEVWAGVEIILEYLKANRTEKYGEC